MMVSVPAFGLFFFQAVFIAMIMLGFIWLWLELPQPKTSEMRLVRFFFLTSVVGLSVSAMVMFIVLSNLLCNQC